MRLDLARVESKSQFIEDNLLVLRELATMEGTVFVSGRFRIVQNRMPVSEPAL